MTGPHNPLSNKAFVNLPPISCCRINCRVLLEGGSSQRQAFPSQPARATAHHAALESSFLRDLAKGQFPVLVALFQAEHVHPPRAHCLIAGLPFYFPQILLRQILVDLHLLVRHPWRAADVLSCDDTAQPVPCSDPGSVPGSLCQRCGPVPPPAPPATGSGGASRQDNSPEEAAAPSQAACVLGGIGDGWAPSCSQERFASVDMVRTHLGEQGSPSKAHPARLTCVHRSTRLAQLLLGNFRNAFLARRRSFS